MSSTSDFKPVPSASEHRAYGTAPPPLHGGPITLIRFLVKNRMLGPKYLLAYARLLWLKLRFRRRLHTDGLCFIGPNVTFEIGRNARVSLGRWSWIGMGTKIRVHEGSITIGAKTVLGQECTLSAYEQIEIGRECILADRVMLIDFDHNVAEVERPIRLQGIYKRPVAVGHNVWIGYGACLLRGVSVGNNSIIGANTVVTKNLEANSVSGGVPARLLRMRETPTDLRWE